MNRVRTSARAIIWRGDALLVVRYRDHRGDWYVLPGGGQEHGEDLASAVRREVEEETGARVTVGSLQFVREYIAGPKDRGVPPGYHAVEHLFACDLISDPTEGSVLDPGQQGAEWLTVEELRERTFFPDTLLGALEQGIPFGYLGVG